MSDCGLYSAENLGQFVLAFVWARGLVGRVLMGRDKGAHQPDSAGRGGAPKSRNITRGAHSYPSELATPALIFTV